MQDLHRAWQVRSNLFGTVHAQGPSPGVAATSSDGDLVQLPTDGAGPGSGTDVVEPEPGEQQRVRGIVAFLLAAVLLAISGAAWYWRSHPDPFVDDGDLLGATLSARQPTLFLGVTYPDPGGGPRITIDRASLRTVENTATATAEFYVCELDRRGRNYGALGVVDPVEFAHVCPSARWRWAGAGMAGAATWRMLGATAPPTAGAR